MNRRFTDFMLEGPLGASELFLWLLLLPLIPIVLLLEGSRKSYEALERAADKAVYGDVYYGGGGDSIFDNVNSARKADIDFLFGGRRR